MTDEEAAPGLAAALAAFQAEIPHVGKNSSATVQGGRQHRYGDLAAITKAALATLGRHGLSFIAKPTMHPEHGFVLNYALMHTSGEAQWGLYPLPSSGSPQAIGSAITYARRYCLCAVTGVAPDDDDDDAAVAEQEHRKRADGLPVNADGSLSRSRTSDAEKAAAGVMTSAQQAEHTALQPKAAEVRGKVTRLTAPEGKDGPSGPWLDQPAAPLEQPTEDKPGSIGPAQRRAIMARYGRAADGLVGDAARTARLEHLSAAVGRPVASVNDLSFVEAKRILAEKKDRAAGAFDMAPGQ